MNPQLIRARELECQVKEHRRRQAEEWKRLSARPRVGLLRRLSGGLSAVAGGTLRVLSGPIESRY